MRTPYSPKIYSPKIYNLFPRLAGDLRQWPRHAERAADMGFDWFYVNPVHFPGFSGSCYAIKDPYRVDPQLLPPGHADASFGAQATDGGESELRRAVARVRDVGLEVMIDLVLNHTSRDSPLTQAHPDWYRRDDQGELVSPSAMDPADARRVTVWGDLAAFDHEGSPDRENLWNYWLRRIENYLDIGFRGFRCDAAYKVPSTLWRRIVETSRGIAPDTLFVAETLGARLEEIEALADCGMQYMLNSSKYWAFDEDWAIEQQRQFAPIMASISFPESHDTRRLWNETGGLECVQKQRYAFAAAFASGVLMPVGYEFGFAHDLHVVETASSDWEEPNVDLRNFVRSVHAWCERIEAFRGEWVEVRSPYAGETLLLERRSAGHLAFVLINKDWLHEKSYDVSPEIAGRRIVRICRDAGRAEEVVSEKTILLQPAEVVYLF